MGQTFPYFRPKLSTSIPYFRLKWLETIYFVAAHTYLAYIGESPPKAEEQQSFSHKN